MCSVEFIVCGLNIFLDISVRYGTGPVSCPEKGLMQYLLFYARLVIPSVASYTVWFCLSLHEFDVLAGAKPTQQEVMLTCPQVRNRGDVEF